MEQQFIYLTGRKMFTCKRCGLCCKDYNPFSDNQVSQCEQLLFVDGKAICKIYETRPNRCRNYPDPCCKCEGGLEWKTEK